MKPDFATLPALPGFPEYRQVDGTWMGREQYDAEGWHVHRDFTRPDGTTGWYWKADLDAIYRYSELRLQRRDDRRRQWQERDEADDEYRRYIDALEDAKPKP
jgi:hypothetical protein